MMHQKVASEDLRIGMCIELPPDTLSNQKDFLEYTISNEHELSCVKNSTRKNFIVRDIKYDDVTSIKPIAHPNVKPNPFEASDRLLMAIADPNLSPKEKASKVYENAITLIESLFESPKAECIKVTKEALNKMSDMILSEQETALQLLKITAYDHNTYAHSVNVGVLSLSLAKQFYGEDSKHDLNELGSAFFLHDIGKTEIPYRILSKPGRLTDEEMEVMREHPLRGLRILKEAGELSEECSVIVSQHHEREDGSGYPYGLTGAQIHEYGKICAIADVFDALTMERSYKKPLTTFEALQIMREKMVGHFDSDLFSKFVHLFNF
ncbi:MAG: HD-GYP domain-containing protein [Candidatus Hinthialibacter antarcticus]|nr:HD-GYP domain-containing protein [Candidatus Hinthialibacter antarcticus]